LLAVTDVFGRGRLLDLGAILDSRLRSIAKEWIPSGASAERQKDGCDGHPCESSQSHSPHSVDKSYRLIGYKGGNSRLKFTIAHRSRASIPPYRFAHRLPGFGAAPRHSMNRHFAGLAGIADQILLN
jgi:hypothetical protein